jgi:hypothetical protein
MLLCLEVQFFSLSGSCVAVYSNCAAPFSNMCSTWAYNSCRKSRLPCGCKFPSCVLDNVPDACQLQRWSYMNFLTMRTCSMGSLSPHALYWVHKLPITYTHPWNTWTHLNYPSTYSCSPRSARTTTVSAVSAVLMIWRVWRFRDRSWPSSESKTASLWNKGNVGY